MLVVPRKKAQNAVRACNGRKERSQIQKQTVYQPKNAPLNLPDVLSYPPEVLFSTDRHPCLDFSGQLLGIHEDVDLSFLRCDHIRLHQ